MSTAPAEAVDPLVRQLLEERLVACVNVLGPARSLYRWQGKIEESEEMVLLLKSTLEHRAALRDRLVELHPYDVPEVLEWEPSGGAPDYLDWVSASCRRGD